MIHVSLNEAKTNLSSIVSNVEHRGEHVIILRHGVAVAEIVPISCGDRTITHEELKDIQIKYDPIAPTEGEWTDV